MTRLEGPVSGEAAMPYRTAAIAQHVPQDSATVRQNRSGTAERCAHTDTTARAMPIANQAK
jgi:hypothetical protein